MAFPIPTQIVGNRLVDLCMQATNKICPDKEGVNPTDRRDFCREAVSKINTSDLVERVGGQFQSTITEPGVSIPSGGPTFWNVQPFNPELLEIGNRLGTDFCNQPPPQMEVPDWVTKTGVPVKFGPIGGGNVKKIQMQPTMGPQDLVVVGTLTSPLWVPAVSAAMASAWAFITANAEIFALAALL